MFLSVDKDLFKLDLSPAEVLIISQIREFEKTTGKCFVGNAMLAQMLNIQERQVQRIVKGLCDRGIINRSVVNEGQRKIRYMTVNEDRLINPITKPIEEPLEESSHMEERLIWSSEEGQLVPMNYLELYMMLSSMGAEDDYIIKIWDEASPLDFSKKI